MTSIREDFLQNIVTQAKKEGAKSNLLDGTENESLGREDAPLSRARTTEVKGLIEVYQLIIKVLDFAREYDGLAYPINFSVEYPPTDVELPCFTTRLLKRGPLVINGRRELASRQMEEYNDPDYAGQKIIEFLRRQENTVQLTVWSRTVKTGSELAEWLEDKFYEYLYAFQWGGIAHPIEWLGRDRDERMEVRGQTIFAFPASLKIITAKKTVRREAALRRLNLSLKLETS